MIIDEITLKLLNDIDNYCALNEDNCPNNCIFDKLGICTEHNAFNSLYDRARVMEKQDND